MTVAAESIDQGKGTKLTLRYRFKRIGEDAIRVRFTGRPEDYGKSLPNGKETYSVRSWGRTRYEVILTGEEMLAFFKLDGVTLNGLHIKPNLADMLKMMIEEIVESQKEQKSYYGERITIRILSEDVSSNADGSINIAAKYLLVGDSGKTYDDITVGIKELTSRLPMPEFYRILLQLSRSGIHATNADIRQYFEIGGNEVPEKYRSDEQTA